MDDAEKSIEFYDQLYNSVPSIGFLSRKKRVRAYIKVTKLTQQMIDAEEISEDHAMYLLSILARKYARFQKAAMMTALSLEQIDKKLLTPVGFKYANELRTNLQLHPV